MAILDRVNYPEDIKELSNDEIKELSNEIREFLIDNVSKTGGHLASNLGVVELTLALHRVFDIPKDKVVWDVGHQAYVHKILTGRKAGFKTLRKYGGMSGFPKPNESKYDAFATGHSSTSISAALGMARARDIKGDKYSVVAVIGDGAMTGGMAFEAMNDAGISNTNMIVVLNDNDMSISKNVGSLSSYLTRLRTEPAYLHFKYDIGKILKKVPIVGSGMYKIAERVKESFKYLVVQGMFFEELGFTYLGPIDGNNIEDTTQILKRAKSMVGPVLVHVVTKKGKGYSYAEDYPSLYHGIGSFNKETGKCAPKLNSTYSQAFGEEIDEEAQNNKDIVAITAAMPDGTGLSTFQKKFPDRFFDVGIAEQHAVTFAAGLAANGLKPVFAVYSTFLQRSYDQIYHDVCMQNLPVCFCIDRAGIVGEDGETHQGILDITYLRSMPNITILAPKDIKEFRMMLKWCFASKTPTAIRYPRGCDLYDAFSKYDLIQKGRWERLIEGNNCTILACGKMVQFSYEACLKLRSKEIRAELVNCRFIKPMDLVMLDEVLSKSDLIITVEDNYISGGFGSSVNEYAATRKFKGRIINLGYPDEFIPHGSVEILYKKYGLDSDGIYRCILKNI